VWTAAATFTVTYDLNGGSGSTPTQPAVTSGTSITLHSGNDLTGPTGTPEFDGWSLTVGGAALTGTTYTVTANVTFYARWKAAAASGPFTVTFDKNAPAYAPDATDASPKTSSTGAGTTVTLPTTNPTYDPKWAAGVTFDGWYPNADGSGTEFTAATTVTANTTVYAKWKFTAGAVDTVGDTLVQSGVTVTQSTSAQHGTWSGTISPRDGSVTYRGGAFVYTLPTGFATYDFLDLEYVYTNLNNTAPNNLICKKGDTSNDYSVVGGTQYIDISPNVTSTVGTLKFAIDPTVSSISIQIYFSNAADAVDITWKITKATLSVAPKVTITFDTDGGAAISPQEISVGKTFTLPVPTKSGCRFLRWEDTSGNKITNFSTITENITLKAVWNNSPATVTDFTVNFTNTPTAANDATPVAMGGASVALSSANNTGYVLTYGADTSYQGSQVKFALTLPAGVNLGDYASITANIRGSSGSNLVNFKDTGVIAATTLPASFDTNPLLGTNLISPVVATGNATGTSGVNLTYTINLAAYDMSNTIEFCIYTPADAGATTRSFTVSNVKFNAKVFPAPPLEINLATAAEDDGTGNPIVFVRTDSDNYAGISIKLSGQFPEGSWVYKNYNRITFVTECYSDVGGTTPATGNSLYTATLFEPWVDYTADGFPAYGNAGRLQAFTVGANANSPNGYTATLDTSKNTPQGFRIERNGSGSALRSVKIVSIKFWNTDYSE